MSEPTGDEEQKPDFKDPTAPVWADPATPQVPAPPAPPMSNPYAQQPPVQPYGQPIGQYSQPQYGQPYPAYGQSPYQAGGPAPSNTSAIVLTIVSGLTTLSTCFIGIPSLVFGILALTSNSTDPVGSRKKARTGWIIFAINVGVGVLIVVIGLIGFAFFSGSGRSNSNFGY